MSSNAYGVKAKKERWRVLEVPELKLFIAIQFLIGLVKIPSRRAAWRRSGFYFHPWVAERMSRNRFEDILLHLHWLDSSDMAQGIRAAKNKENPFWCLQTLLEALAESCRKYFVPGQDIDIDEQCFPFKGRHRARCFNPNKPWKFHFKNYCLNDARTCYTWNFFMYRGKDDGRPPDLPATEYPCHVLTDYPVLADKGYIFYCDNWYTTVPLW